MRRTKRDHELLKSLAVKVRILSLSQVAKAWWSEATRPEVHARRRLSELRDAKAVRETTVPASPLLNLRRPVVAWRIGQPEPDHSAVARTLLNRGPALPTKPTSVFSASESTNNLYGGALSLRPIHPSHVDHDLHVGEVYLLYLREHPRLAEHWIGEDVQPKAGYRLKDPDAALEFEGGARIHAVEFGGRYDSERVRDFHQDCKRRGRSYEIW